MDFYYKYRSLSNLRRFLDIIINRRLFASQYLALNDPMEGFFLYDLSIQQAVIQQLRCDKSKTLICSLSKNYNNGLMWSVYADEHKGCCIKLSVTSKSWTKLKIEYKDHPALINNQNIDVKNVLSVKSPQWKHEEEVRFIKKDPSKPYIQISIDKIYLGMKVSRSDLVFYKNLIEKINDKIEVKKLKREDIDFGFIK